MVSPEVDNISNFFIVSRENDGPTAVASRRYAPSALLDLNQSISRPLSVWYCILNHAGPDIIKQLAEVVDCIRLSDTKPFACEPCGLSKSATIISRRSQDTSRAFLVWFKLILWDLTNQPARMAYVTK